MAVKSQRYTPAEVLVIPCFFIYKGNPRKGSTHALHIQCVKKVKLNHLRFYYNHRARFF